jgi:hypothetical protein
VCKDTNFNYEPFNIVVQLLKFFYI